jgi:hypothetical protein
MHTIAPALNYLRLATSRVFLAGESEKAEMNSPIEFIIEDFQQTQSQIIAQAPNQLPLYTIWRFSTGHRKFTPLVFVPTMWVTHGLSSLPSHCEPQASFGFPGC